MKTIFDQDAYQSILARLAKLTPDVQRQWGTMSVGKMLCHTGDQLRCALGEIRAEPATGPLTLKPVRWLAINVSPWPKGRIDTAPVLLKTDAGLFEEDRDELERLIRQFVMNGAQGYWHPHPLFGALSGKAWGRVAYRHLDHHFKQFGC